MKGIAELKFGEVLYGLTDFTKVATQYTYVSKHPERIFDNIVLDINQNPFIMSDYDLIRILKSDCKKFEDAIKLEIIEKEEEIKRLKFTIFKMPKH